MTSCRQSPHRCRLLFAFASMMRQHSVFLRNSTGNARNGFSYCKDCALKVFDTAKGGAKGRRRKALWATALAQRGFQETPVIMLRCLRDGAPNNFSNRIDAAPLVRQGVPKRDLSMLRGWCAGRRRKRASTEVCTDDG